MSRTVVLTGASAGVGRATAREFGRRGDKVALLARNRDALEAAAEEIRREGGTALAIPTDVADPSRSKPPPSASSASSGRSTSGSTTRWRRSSRRVWDIEPAEFRRVTEVTYLGAVLRHDGRAQADAPAQPRHDRRGRVGAGLPRHPAAVGLLRLQARHQGLHRVAADRAARREERRARDDGPPARAQHDAVRARAARACRAPRGRSRPSTSPRSPRARSSTRRATPSAARTGSAARPC